MHYPLTPVFLSLTLFLNIFPASAQETDKSNRQICLSDALSAEQAIAACNQLLKNQALDTKLLLRRAHLLLDQENYQAALKDLEQVLKLNPKMTEALRLKAQLHFSLEQYSPALALLNQAIQIQPADTETYFERAVTKVMLNQSSEALLDFSQAIHLNHNHIEALNRRAMLYESLNQYELALKDYDHLIELEPRNYDYYYRRGYSHLNLKHYQQAQNDALAASDIDPSRPEAQALLKKLTVLFPNSNESHSETDSDSEVISFEKFEIESRQAFAQLPVELPVKELANLTIAELRHLLADFPGIDQHASLSLIHTELALAQRGDQAALLMGLRQNVDSARRLVTDSDKLTEILAKG